MDILEKQAVWREQKPLFEAEFIHSHLLPFFNFNENTGDYEIKSECVNNTDDEDRKVAYETLNTGWVMWLRAKRDAKAQAVPEGFVLVPKELTHEQAVRISDDENFFETYQTILTESDTSEDSAAILIQTAHKAMIAAGQEPAND